MTATPHETALMAATKAWMDDRGIESDVSRWIDGITIAVDAYLSSIGGVVCHREPSAWLLVDPDGMLASQATVRPQEPSDLLDIVTLHAPLSIAGKGDDEITRLRSERDAAKALCDEMAKALEEAKFALFSSDMTIRDRADQSMRLAIAAYRKAQEVGNG